VRIFWFPFDITHFLENTWLWGVVRTGADRAIVCRWPRWSVREHSTEIYYLERTSIYILKLEESKGYPEVKWSNDWSIMQHCYNIKFPKIICTKGNINFVACNTTSHNIQGKSWRFTQLSIVNKSLIFLTWPWKKDYPYQYWQVEAALQVKLSHELLLVNQWLLVIYYTAQCKKGTREDLVLKYKFL